jgi:hypothetical protein
MLDVEVFVVEVWNVDLWMEVDVVTGCFDEVELKASAEEEDRNTVIEVVVDVEVEVE